MGQSSKTFYLVTFKNLNKNELDHKESKG